MIFQSETSAEDIHCQETALLISKLSRHMKPRSDKVTLVQHKNRQASQRKHMNNACRCSLTVLRFREHDRKETKRVIY